MHAKPDLRVVLKWMIAGSGSVITDVIFTVFLSLAVFYIVTLWGTRRWPELRIRLLLSVFCGGILGAMLCPAVSRVLNYENATLAWFLDPSGPLDVVVSALFCGFLFTLVPILLAPRNTTIAR